MKGPHCPSKLMIHSFKVDSPEDSQHFFYDPLSLDLYIISSTHTLTRIKLAGPIFQDAKSFDFKSKKFKTFFDNESIQKILAKSGHHRSVYNISDLQYVERNRNLVLNVEGRLFVQRVEIVSQKNDFNKVSFMGVGSFSKVAIRARFAPFVGKILLTDTIPEMRHVSFLFFK